MSNGRYAKDAIRQRLAAARAWEASMAEIFESARVKLTNARNEVRAAEAMMKEAERRWPEIEIDDEASTVIPPSKKRKKVVASSSTGGIAVAAAATTAGIVAATEAGQSETEVGVPNAAAVLHTSNDNNGDVMQVTFANGEVVVKKCKHPGVNGTFKMRDGSEVYEKSGQWKGERVTFVMKNPRRIGPIWYSSIGMRISETQSQRLYTQWTANEIRSETGWVRYHSDKNQKVVVEGCKYYPEVNGTFSRIQGCGVYTRLGWWKGARVGLEMYRECTLLLGFGGWVFCVNYGDRSERLYVNWTDELTPPEAGWIGCGNGTIEHSLRVREVPLKS